MFQIKNQKIAKRQEALGTRLVKNVFHIIIIINNVSFINLINSCIVITFPKRVRHLNS